MSSIVLAVFLVLHSGVHLLYLGQSVRFFELQPGLAWPDGAWAFAHILAADTLRRVASVLLVLAAILFAAGGIGLLLDQGWWRPLTVAATVLSSLIFMLLWDGKRQDMDDKGLVSIPINAAILLVVLVFG